MSVEAEHAGGGLGVVEEQLVEVAHAEQQQRIAGGRLGLVVLLHHRGGGHRRECSSEAKMPRGEIVAELFTKLRFAAEDVVVVLGEAVGFVADVLQQPQGEGVAARVGAARFRRGGRFLLPAWRARGASAA